MVRKVLAISIVLLALTKCWAGTNEIINIPATKVNIPFGSSNNAQTLDLTSYISDSSVKAVILQTENNASTIAYTDVRFFSTGYTGSQTRTSGQLRAKPSSGNPSYLTQVVALDNSNQIKAKLVAPVNESLYIIGELKGSGVVRFADMREVTPSTSATWVNVNLANNSEFIQTDKPEAVILATYCPDNSAFALGAGVRPVGSVSGTFICLAAQESMTFRIVKLDDNKRYQVYASIKSGSPDLRIFEVGYIKKGYGYHAQLHGPLESTGEYLGNVAATNAWTTLNIKNTKGAGGSGRIGIFNMDSIGGVGQTDFYLRPVGSSISPMGMGNGASNRDMLVDMDSSQNLQYYTGDTGSELGSFSIYFEGYVEPVGKTDIVSDNIETVAGKNLILSGGI